MKEAIVIAAEFRELSLNVGIENVSASQFVGDIFAQMDAERDSIMCELDGAAVPQLPAAKK